MSRTDKTKPPWVRQREHGGLAFHDHTQGPCDLPPEPPRVDTGTRCRWGTVIGIASTWRCCVRTQERSAYKEMQDIVKIANRRLRYAGRRAARRWETDAD